MADGASGIFLLLSAVISLGFVGYLLFERTRISDVLLLIAFGVLVGPALHLIPTNAFTDAAPFITSLALAMIMFEGGLELRATDIVKGAGRGALLAIISFVLGTAGMATVAHYWIHLDWLPSILLGAALGHTSSVVVFPILKKLGLSDRVRAMLGIESAIAEVLSVVSVITIAEAIVLGNADVGHAASQMAAQFSVAIVLGIVGGILWSRLLIPLSTKRYSYMLTLAAILALHVGTGALGGSSPISVLVFGIIVGNSETVRKTGLAVGDFSPEMRTFQGEISFFLRTFFFVYLGLTLSLGSLLNLEFVKAAGLLVGAIFLARIITARVSLTGKAREPRAAAILGIMIPRGLAAAVLAGIPFATYGVAETQNFPAYALGVILLTNLVTTIGVFIFGRARASDKASDEISRPGEHAEATTSVPVASE